MEYKLPHTPLVIRYTVIIYSASDYSDDGIQNKPFIGGIQISPEEISEAL
ncbi:hypothetical protein KU15F73_45490 [Escherichia coli]